MWKTKYVAIDTEPVRGRIPEDSSWARKVSFVWFDLAPGDIQGAEITNIRTYQKTKLGIQAIVDEVRDILAHDTIVAHNLDYQFMNIQSQFKALGVEPAIFPSVRVDTLLTDFRVRPGKRLRRLDAVCRRWGVEFGLPASTEERAIAIGFVAAKMIPRMPDSEIVLDTYMSEARKDWLHMRAAHDVG